MKRVLPAIALIVGLGLAGCSGGESSSAPDSGGGESKETAAEAPQATQLDKDQLTKIVEATKVGETTFKAMDIGSAAGAAGAAAEAMKDAEFEPAECKEVATAALNAAGATDANTVAGVAADNSVSVGLMSFADDKASGGHFSNAGAATEKCKEVTVKVAGAETKMTYETFDASVPGADETVGVTSSMEVPGAPAMTTETVTSRVGNNVVSFVNITPEGDEQSAIDGATAFVEALKNAG